MNFVSIVVHKYHSGRSGLIISLFQTFIVILCFIANVNYVTIYCLVGSLPLEEGIGFKIKALSSLYHGFHLIM